MATQVAPAAKYISAERVHLPPEKLTSLVVHGPEFAFDPAHHLQYEPPEHRYSMTEVGIDPASTDNRHGVPSVIDFAYTKPFRLLSPEGVQAMRQAVLSDKVLNSCPMQVKDRSGHDYTHWQLRNPSKYSNFIKEFWSSDAVTSKMCDALQYEVVPSMEFEMGHTNLQAPNHDKYTDGVTGWHNDTNCQFVCIVCLSDPTNMVGGETAFKRGDGSVALVRYPAAGYAIMMQGLNILHSVTEVTAGTERMTMVTSYQPKDPLAPQNGRIRGIHSTCPDGDKYQMLAEFASWRLRVLSARMADLASKVEGDLEDGKFDLELVKKKAANFQSFLDVSMQEVQ